MAVVFDGNDSILLPNIVIPNATTGIATFTFWMRADALGAGTTRIWGSGTHMECRHDVNGIVDNDVFEITGPGDTETISSLVIGTWAFIVCTGDANTDNGAIYFDGVLEDDEIGTHNGTTVGVDMSFGVRTGTTNFYTGALDDWREYDRILPTPEIETMFALRGNDGIVDGLVHRFTFREGAPGVLVPTTLADIAGGGGGAGLTITGNPVFEESELKFARAA